MFGDDYPRFIELSDLTPKPQPLYSRERHRGAIEQRNRMNERYEAMLGSNRDILDGARVLDLASHDGRYSFAALKAGAAHVTGVEVRQSLVDRAQEAFAFYDQDPETYRFVCGDVFEVLARERFDVDVVLCFGYLYHTYRHTELMYRLHSLAPRHLIIDTMVTRATQPTLEIVPRRRRRGHPQCRPGCLCGGTGLGVAALGARPAETAGRLRFRDRVPVRLEEQVGRPTARAWSRGLRERQARDRAMPLPGKRLSRPDGSRSLLSPSMRAHRPGCADADGPRRRPPHGRPVGGANGSTPRWPWPRATSCSERPPSEARKSMTTRCKGRTDVPLMSRQL